MVVTSKVMNGEVWGQALMHMSYCMRDNLKTTLFLVVNTNKYNNVEQFHLTKYKHLTQKNFTNKFGWTITVLCYKTIY
jgi:hypothetical protein